MNREVEELFPSYQHESQWKQTVKQKKDELIELWEDWEFSNGRFTHMLKDKFLELLGPVTPGTYLTDLTEIHLRETLRQIEQCPTVYNFYKDANPPESLKIYIPLGSLIHRVSGLLEEWPEHSVLQEIQSLSYKVLSLPLLKAPLKQLSVGVDKILEKVQDWEDYSCKSVSLKPETEKIYTVLKAWRELELYNWQGILDACQRDAINNDNKIWGRLIRVLVSEDTELSKLYEAIDEYIKSSSLGIFLHRVHTIELLEPHVPSGLSLVLHHSGKIFQQFIDPFQELKNELDEPLKNRVTEIIRIARFDISSYHSWKLTVLKSQKQLNKVIRTHKGNLKTPFSQVLTRLHEKYTASLLETPMTLKDIPESNEYEELASSIFSYLDSLKETTSHSRRTALLDLFSSLRSLGFTQFYHETDLSSQFYSQSKFPLIPPEIQTVVSAAESYYYKNTYKMGILLSSLSKSEDLSLEEKEKCIGFAKNIYSRTIETRSSLVSALCVHNDSIILPPDLSSQVAHIHSLAKQALYHSTQQALLTHPTVQIALFPFTNTLFDLLPANTVLPQLLSHGDFSLTSPVALPLLSIPQFSVALPQEYKSQSKVLYIVLSLFISLFTNGFCQAEEQQDETKQGTGEGTGLSEGKGLKNISNELIDEEQFQELQGQNSEEQENLEDEDALDVKQEFQGEDMDVDEELKEPEDEKIQETEGNEKPLDPENETREDPNSLAENTETAEVVQSYDNPGSPQGSPESIEMQENAQEELSELELESPHDQSMHSGETSSEGEQTTEKPQEIQAKTTENNEFEEEKLEEFRDRELTEYNNEAFGVEHLPANTDKMKGDEPENEQENAAQDIVSNMKGEWSASAQRESEMAAEQEEALEKTLENAQVVNNEETAPLDSSEFYTFDPRAQDIAEVPSLHHNESLSKLPLNSEEHQKVFPEPEEFPSEGFKKLIQEPSHVSSQEIQIFEFEESHCSYTSKPTVPVPSSPVPTDPSPFTLTEPAVQPAVLQWEDLEYSYTELSQDLCEQLRIILEPTKAKALQGDYRTGKRINMKKIISYFASNFRKDKIWLRRTRHSAREYQVLLAIDDSFSMKQHSLGEMAKKGLYVVAAALTKLEVGEIGVAAVRNGMSLLHPVGEPFTEDSGGNVLAQLEFNYGLGGSNDMNFPNFLAQANEYLRTVSTGNMQLLLIISDGRLNKNKVRPLLRGSTDICYVFVILDNPKNSILAMKSTVFTENSGKRQLKVYPYLEDFPFEYYVVVQSPDLLPNTLADLIKQWFQVLNT